MCSLIVPRCIAASVMPYILESTLFAMPCDGNNMLFDKQALEKALQGVKALGLGMGWEKARIMRKFWSLFEFLRYTDSH